ncbi:hypothetical protein ABIE00_002774 [Arthrobacter sp. OAP107]
MRARSPCCTYGSCSGQTAAVPPERAWRPFSTVCRRCRTTRCWARSSRNYKTLSVLSQGCADYHGEHTSGGAPLRKLKKRLTPGRLPTGSKHNFPSRNDDSLRTTVYNCFRTISCKLPAEGCISRLRLSVGTIEKGKTMTREEAFATCAPDSYVEFYGGRWLVVPFAQVEQPRFFVCAPQTLRSSKPPVTWGSAGFEASGAG